jgi:hypothetical protein
MFSHVIHCSTGLADTSANHRTALPPRELNDGRLREQIANPLKNRYNSRLAEGERFVAVGPESVTSGLIGWNEVAKPQARHASHKSLLKPFSMSL